MVEQLSQQDIQLESALAELEKLKGFLGDPSHILGSAKTKHGEIAENYQVYVSNAKRLIEGLQPQHTFDDVPRTGPADYMRNGAPIQQKYYNGPRNTIEAIKKHLETYPDFLRKGGSYDIPKDQYDHIVDILDKPSSQLSRSDQSLVKVIREWEEKNGIQFQQKVSPAEADYAAVQTGKIDETVADAQKEIEQKDKEQRNEIQKENAPSLKEGVKVTAIAAVFEGGMQFSLAMYHKLKSGKKLTEFTEEDWKEIGVSTAKGTGTGAVRGAGTYMLTNFTCMNSLVANGYITATIGIVNQANQYRKGGLSQEDFLINSQVLCLDAAISVVSATLGTVAIPVPILGAVIGSSVGNYLSGLGKEYLSKQEQELIARHRREIDELIAKLQQKEQQLIRQLNQEYQRFSSLAELAFDFDINLAFIGSVHLARYVGVDDSKILKTKSEVDHYFLD